MTRSIGRRHRLARLAAMGAALAAAGLLSACSAGQLAETSRIVPAVPGGGVTVQATSTDAPNGAIMVQNATITFQSGGYQAGQVAPLNLWVTNNTNSPVTVAPSTAPATLRNSQGTVDTTLGTVGWQAAAGAAGGSGPVSIPPDATIPLTPSQARYLGITLQQALPPATVAQIGLVFQGPTRSYTAVLVVPVGPPASPEPRVSATAPPSA